MKVYFDQNIFDDIRKLIKDSKTNDDITLLQSAVNKGKLTILLGSTVLQETFPLLNHSSKTFREELEVIFALVKKPKMIKSAKILLREAIESYAYNRKLPDMQTKIPILRPLKDFLRTGKVSPILLELKDIALAEKKNFTKEFNQRFKNGQKRIAESNISRPTNFKEFWKSYANFLAIDLAKSCDLSKKCLERGAEGLLELKPIRLYCIYNAHLIFANLFGEPKVPEKVEASYRGDLFHSVQAAAADIFVTNDKRLARWLNEVQVDNFKIINFNQLIEGLS